MPLQNRRTPYLKRTKRLKQNKEIINNHKLLYRKLAQEGEPENPSGKKLMHQYWINIWGEPIQHDPSSNWIKRNNINGTI